MDVKDAAQLKQLMEQDIASYLIRWSGESGLEVTAVNISKRDVTNAASKGKEFMYEVTCTVELP